jgi:hypothetical protein
MAMIQEILPGQLRHTGGLWYTEVLPWTVRVEDARVVVVPCARGIRNRFAKMIGIAALGFLAGWLIFGKLAGMTGWIFLAAVLLGPAGLIVAAAFILALSLLQIRRGPFFRYEGKESGLEFVRLKCVVRADQALHWDIVPGSRLRGSNGSTRRVSDGTLELQLVFADRGRLFSAPLVSGSSRRQMEHAAVRIAGATDVPLKRNGVAGGRAAEMAGAHSRGAR